MFIYFVALSALGSLQVKNISEKRKIWFQKVSTPLTLTCACLSLDSVVRKKNKSLDWESGDQVPGLFCYYVIWGKLFYFSDSVSLFVKRDEPPKTLPVSGPCFTYGILQKSQRVFSKIITEEIFCLENMKIKIYFFIFRSGTKIAHNI